MRVQFDEKKKYIYILSEMYTSNGMLYKFMASLTLLYTLYARIWVLYV